MLYEKASEIEQAAGPRMTTNNTGRMKRISGTVMIAARRAAFSSARIMRSLRNLADRTRRAEARGVHSFSGWIMVVKTPDRQSVVSGQIVSVRVDCGGRSLIKKKKI